MHGEMHADEFIRYYDLFSDALFRYCYVRVSHRERAKDLVQESFTRTWEYLRGGRRVDNIRAFLYRVANNLIIDESRKSRAISLDALAEQGYDPPADGHGVISHTAEAAELLRLLDRLSPEQRALITMRYVDELGPKEIAEIVGVSENVVSVRLHRAVRYLKKLTSLHES